MTACLILAAIMLVSEFNKSPFPAIYNMVEAQSLHVPELPRVYLNTAYVPATGSTIRVPAGGNLQTALNAANPGDVIVLDAGATYIAPSDGFVLPYKAGSGWITIQTSNLAGIPAEGTRVNPSVHSAAMPKILARDAGPAIVAVTRAGQSAPHHYRFVGIEIALAPTVTFNHGLVRFGENNDVQNTMAAVPHDLIIDRCYIHGRADATLARGVGLNSARSAVIDSYISECHGVGFDTQAIAGWNGPGPFKIVNNYLEGAGENVMFGGADPKIPDLVPSDIEFRRNYCYKPLSWKVDEPNYGGRHWSVKNIFELKNARRVLVDGNVFENNWVDGQNGTAILFTVRNQEGTAPWSA
ncbi:MAG TPA: hypothetical protein VE262_17495, partial [Blastocatellia bacterium]|nr:hypothetical protein [Blastocatellia bacterium]